MTPIYTPLVSPPGFTRLFAPVSAELSNLYNLPRKQTSNRHESRRGTRPSLDYGNGRWNSKRAPKRGFSRFQVAFNPPAFKASLSARAAGKFIPWKLAIEKHEAREPLHTRSFKRKISIRCCKFPPWRADRPDVAKIFHPVDVASDYYSMNT